MLPTIHGGESGCFSVPMRAGRARRVPNLTPAPAAAEDEGLQGLRLRFKLTEAEQEQCRAFGIEFAKTVLGK